MKKKIFALLGDYYHEHNLILKTLKEALKPLESQVELRDIEVGDIESALNENPDLIIINKENRVNPTEESVYLWMTPEIENKLSDYVRNGGRLLAWHAGLASYPEEGPYAAMLRGVFKFHPRVNKIVKYEPRGTSFFTGKPVSFEAIDEHYFVECDLQNTNVFLVSESVDGTSMAGWAHRFGQGRVCCITPTHRVEGLTNPELIRLVRESVQWLL